jgi:nucleoid-associated protein YgaU
MMDPAVKTALALCVLLAGVCAALLFRRDPAHSAPPTPNSAELLLIRQRAGALNPGLPSIQTGRSTPTRQNAANVSAGKQSATVVTPSERQESPPLPADSYPGTNHPASSRWGVSMDMMLPVTTPADDATRSHKIVDGDTLPALAERFLGSAARANEIFEANRDLLARPELLPIGVELKIPPRSSRPK